MRVLERLNSPIALVVALTVFLVLDGLLLYRYQQSLRSTEGGASNAPVEEGTSPLGAGSTTVSETTLPQRERPTTEEETSPVEETSPEEKEEREGGVRVVVEVVGVGGVGLTVLEDGRIAYDQVAGSGFSEEFRGEETVTVTTADAGAVQVGVNGEDLGPLGAPGQQATRTFTAEE